MSKVIVQGNAQGKVLKSTNPINFLGAVDKKTGIIRDKKYDIFEKSMKDTVLVFPHGIGSSVGAYTIYSLKSNQSLDFFKLSERDGNINTLYPTNKSDSVGLASA